MSVTVGSGFRCMRGGVQEASEQSGVGGRYGANKTRG